MTSDAIAQLLRTEYGIDDASIIDLHIPVNDVLRVSTSAGEYALKLYNVRSRPIDLVRWEMDLLAVLGAAGVPIAAPNYGRDGPVCEVDWQGTRRAAVLYAWAPGEKPAPGRETYLQLGAAAARIHAAADGFVSQHPRERYDRAMLIDIQQQRLEPYLRRAGVWQRFSALADRMRDAISDPHLDFGVCHMDLTLDNVHVLNGSMTVFDFDSAAEGWRANEAHGVLRFSQEAFADWLEGYRFFRPFAEADERAARAFGIIGEIRGVSWKLGLAESSRGTPLITFEALPGILADWLAWEERMIVTL